MKKYIGTKEVQAEPITLGEFIELTGRNPYTNDINAHEEKEEGYLVKYEDGYKSFSPKSVFEKSYRCAETFIDRLIIEVDELAVKVGKLGHFVRMEKAFEELSKEHQNYLTEQLDLMIKYVNVLDSRISLLNSQNNKGK